MPTVELLDIKCNGQCSNNIKVKPFFRNQPMGPGNNKISHSCSSGWTQISGDFSESFTNSQDGYLKLKYKDSEETWHKRIDKDLANAKERESVFDFSNSSPRPCKIWIRYRVVPD